MVSHCRTIGRVALLLIAALILGCASPASVSRAQRGEITKQEAISIAHAELAKRKLQKPAGARVEVEDSVATVEFGPSRPTYLVSFRVGRPSPRSALYSMSVDRASGQVDGFIDIRDSIPVR